MKINIKKQVLELMQTLYEGVHYIGSIACIEKQEMLEQCVECKEAIEKAVCKEESQGKLLEAFKVCTSLMLQLKQSMEDEVLRSTFIARIMETLEEIYEYILNVMPTEKQKVVFLPYKASMWDSFDSIYKAAQLDDEWEVVVLPIPYFTANEKREIVGKEYEGNQLPSYVEIVDYNKYDLATQKPDVIFIHNPYDGTNKVTQVLPEYFSSELVKYTNKLVYVPYFCNGGVVGAHFTVAPGVRNSWRTFVEHEAARESYLQFNPEEKIIALGSPKNDMVRTIKKEDLDIPLEWQVCFKDKTIYMYNTHLTSIMADPEGFIKKIKYVIAHFVGREDIALLWRPHPLSIQTIDSTCPHIKEAYLNIIHEFKNLKNTIYDESSDLHRAIAISDTYVGDGTSSVVNLYKQTGKPMFILNIENHITDENIEETLYSSAAKVINDKLWFSAGNFNGLFKLNLSSKQISYIGEFKGEDKLAICSHQFIASYKECLIFIPYGGKCITTYNRHTEEMKEYPLRASEYAYGKFASMCINQEYLWIFPHKYNAILCFNMETGEIEYLDEWYKVLHKQIGGSHIGIFEDSVVIDDTVWLSCKQNNAVMTFNLNTRAYKIHRVGSTWTNLGKMTYDGLRLWFVKGKQGKLLKWKPLSDSAEEISLIDEALSEVGEIKNICYWNNYVWAMPMKGTKLAKINIENDEVEWLEVEVGNFEEVKPRQVIMSLTSMEVDGEYMYIIPTAGSGVLRIHQEKLKLESISLKVDEVVVNDVCKESQESMLDTNILYERVFTLKRFISLMQGQRIRAQQIHDKTNLDETIMQNTAGGRIWHYVINH